MLKYTNPSLLSLACGDQNHSWKRDFTFVPAFMPTVFFLFAIAKANASCCSMDNFLNWLQPPAWLTSSVMEMENTLLPQMETRLACGTSWWAQTDINLHYSTPRADVIRRQDFTWACPSGWGTATLKDGDVQEKLLCAVILSLHILKNCELSPSYCRQGLHSTQCCSLITDSVWVTGLEVRGYVSTFNLVQPSGLSGFMGS